MSNQNPKNYDDLDDVYSDLSDNQDNKKPQPPPQLPPQQSHLSSAPVFIKLPDGRKFIPPPPPPPPSSRPLPQQQQQMYQFPQPDQQPQTNRPINYQFPQKQNTPSSSSQSQSHHHTHNNQRQRRNMVYIKNIPKTYNKQQALTTFFRSYGNIKSIKTNQQQNTAFVRFQKQQDAYKFMQTKPSILNRSYIVYDSNQNFIVPPQKIAERQKDQLIALNHANQKQTIQMKDAVETTIADKYRALLFLMKNKNNLTQQQIHEVQRQMIKCRRIKDVEGDLNLLKEMLQDFRNNYDWTLSYKVITKQAIDKKKIINQYNKQFGPVGTINIKLNSINQNEQEPTQQNVSQQNLEQTTQDKIATIKIKFLGVKNSWEMYLKYFSTLNIEVENILVSSIVKLQQQKKQEERVKALEQQKLKEQAQKQEQEQEPDKVEELLKQPVQEEPIEQARQNVLAVPKVEPIIGTQEQQDIPEISQAQVLANDKKEEKEQNLQNRIEQPNIVQDQSQENKDAKKEENK